jgi:hypothetical protein
MAQDYMGHVGQESHGDQGKSSHEDTRSAIRSAVNRTQKTVQSGYNRAVEYGSEHPQQFSVLTFAAGVGIGALLANVLSNRSTRTERLASPLIDVAADMARGYLRR